jgi:TonB family protein
VLILELVAVFQWFNPFFWLFRRALRENHEFLADRAVLSRGAKPAWYKQTLVNQYVGDQIVLTNNFNYSLIKIRIKMMSKIKSRKIALAKVTFGVLMAAALIVSFGFQKDKIVPAEVASASPQDKIVVVTGTSPSKTVTIQFDGKPLSVSGDAATIEKLKLAIAQSKAYRVTQSANIDEVVVVAYAGTESKPAASPAIKLETISDNSWAGEKDIVAFCEQMPEYPEGEKSMMQFINKAIKYPTSAQQAGIQGRVFVTFIVETDGSIKLIKVARSVDPALDAEAIRVIQSMPNWIPGRQDGKPVRVAFTMPINFVLN